MFATYSVFGKKIVVFMCSFLHCRDMKNTVIGNRNQKEKFVQSQIIPKYVNVVILRR